VVEIEEQTLSEDHPDRLASQHALAGAYQANGQIKEAVSLLKQVVEIREQTLSEDHPSRLASQRELACIRLVHLNLTKAEKQTGRIWTGQEVALKLTYHKERRTRDGSRSLKSRLRVPCYSLVEAVSCSAVRCWASMFWEDSSGSALSSLRWREGMCIIHACRGEHNRCKLEGFSGGRSCSIIRFCMFV
jgi:Tetratricopeptide repeat